jgi:hypothetical protein
MSMLKKADWSQQQRRSLKPTEIVTRLANLPGWKLSGDGEEVAIEKSFGFAGALQPLHRPLPHPRRARHQRDRLRLRRASRRAAGMRARTLG